MDILTEDRIYQEICDLIELRDDYEPYSKYWRRYERRIQYLYWKLKEGR